MAFKAVLFDAYGTLFDVGAAVARAGAPLGPKGSAVSALWRAKQLEYAWTLSLMGAYEDFWTLTERGLDHALAAHGIADPALRAALLDAYRRLDAYPEAAAALRALKARGLSTGVFTNGSRAMVEAAIAAAGLGDWLDHVVTVEPVRLFKTAPQTYAHAVAAIGVRREAILFVSSNRWDVAGATRAGLASIWVNRLGAPDEYPEAAPIAVVSDLGAVAALAG